jgi:hypothetical protein
MWIKPMYTIDLYIFRWSWPIGLLVWLVCVRTINWWCLIYWTQHFAILEWKWLGKCNDIYFILLKNIYSITSLPCRFVAILSVEEMLIRPAKNGLVHKVLVEHLPATSLVLTARRSNFLEELIVSNIKINNIF